MSRVPLLFIVESGTDVRMVEGLAEVFDLQVLARKINGGVEISHRPASDVPITIGPPGRGAFGAKVFSEILRWGDRGVVLVQGYGVAALAANLARQITNVSVLMIVCSPMEAYYRCRLQHGDGHTFRKREAVLIDLLARANGLVGQRYVVLSQYLESVVRAHGAHSVYNIPVYGVNTRLFCPPLVAKTELKRQLGLPTGGTLIFFSSRVAPEKDSETLLRALRSLLDRGHNLWILHRSGGYLRFLADAARFGVKSRVVATDAVHPHRQLPIDYQASDICVQASREEGLGFSPLEALACGTPVIATAVGGLQETIIRGETGWTYPVGDSDGLANCLIDVIANPAVAAGRTLQGRFLVQEKFERSHVFGNLATLVDRILVKNNSIH